MCLWSVYLVAVSLKRESKIQFLVFFRAAETNKQNTLQHSRRQAKCFLSVVKRCNCLTLPLHGDLEVVSSLSNLNKMVLDEKVFTFCLIVYAVAENGCPHLNCSKSSYNKSV